MRATEDICTGPAGVHAWAWWSGVWCLQDGHGWAERQTQGVGQDGRAMQAWAWATVVGVDE